MESDPRSGRPYTNRKEEVIDQVREKVLEDRRLTVQEIVAQVGKSTGSVHSILTEDLNLRRVSTKFVPKLLTEQQKELRKEISEDVLDLANHDPEFIKTIIAGDDRVVNRAGLFGSGSGSGLTFRKTSGLFRARYDAYK